MCIRDSNIEVPETSITAIIQMFENTLDNMDELDNQNIYVPVFLMDYSPDCPIASLPPITSPSILRRGRVPSVKVWVW